MTGPDDIEQWFWVRARWVVDLLRSGMNVGDIGMSGMGKSVTMHYAESMLAAHGLTECVRFFYEWKGSHPLPRRSPNEVVVVEVSRSRRHPPGVRCGAADPAPGTGAQRRRRGPAMTGPEARRIGPT